MPIDAAARAQAIQRKIERKPSSVVFIKPKVTLANGTVTPETALPAQIVRVVADNRATPVEGVAGAAPTRAVIIYGVKDHPDAAVVDTNIQVGYTTRINNQEYRVTQIWLVPGGVQAQARIAG